MQYSDVISALVKALPTDVLSFMIVTPTDTKMFDIEGREQPIPSRQRVTPAPALPDASEPDDEDIQDRFIAEAEAGDAIIDANASAIAAATAEAESAIASADTPAARRKAMMDMRRAERAGSASTCGRCSGAGVVPVAMPDGRASQAACPLCQGKGAIQRYGARAH